MFAAFRTHPFVVHASHILAWLLIAGVFLIPGLSVWGYRTVVIRSGQVLGATTSAYEELSAAEATLRHFDLNRASRHLVRAHEQFLEIDEALGIVGRTLTKLAALTPKGRSYYHLARGAFYITEAGTFFNEPLLFAADAASSTGVSSSLSSPSESESSIITRIKTIHTVLMSARPSLIAAERHIQKVAPKHFPEEHQRGLTSLKQGLELLVREFEPGVIALENFLTLLGTEETKRYVLLFQNNGELRPTGGFIGTLAFVDVKDGAIKRFFTPAGGSYDLHYGKRIRVHAPKPFRVLNPEWEIQDCNWLPDFSYSAKRCALFAEESFGASADGVIALTTDMARALLELVGPIVLPEYDVIITHENFVEFVQVQVETDAARESGVPKQFLADLLPRVLRELFALLDDPRSTAKLADVVLGALEQKQLLLWMNDENIQSWLESNNWAGRMGSPKGDYLMVNAATVNGGKSDFSVRQSIEYNVVGNAEGATATVSVTRQHTAERLAPDALVTDRERLFNSLVSERNVSYVRVYAREGARLIGVDGDIFDATPLIKKSDVVLRDDRFLTDTVQNPLIDEPTGTRMTREFGKTVFGNYLLIDPGEEKQLRFTYSLPAFDDNYTLLLQTQPGITSEVRVVVNGAVLFEGVLEKDVVLSR